MRTRYTNRLRALAASGAFLGLLGAVAGAQPASGGSGNEIPTSVVLASEADTVRVSHTADGQLFVRILGSTPAMLVIDDAVGRVFVAKLQAYAERMGAPDGCPAMESDDAIPRLAAPRAHRSGIDGIALRCRAGGSAPGFTVLVSRPSREDGPPLAPLAITADLPSVRGFARDIERMISAKRR